MKILIWLLIVVLVLLHQDYWEWDDTTLVAGFLPYTLVYHVGISLGAAVLWYLATVFCWPSDLDSIQPEDETVAGGEARS